MSGNTKSVFQEDKFFTWRGKEVSRIENLSDIVFALALTLIVASSVPSSFNDISAMWREGIAIAICFVVLLAIWYEHYLFFRRYDLEDRRTILLNSMLIFLVMVFAYPLKFLVTFLVNLFTGYFTSNQEIASVLSLEQAPWLTVIYSFGYAAVFFVYGLLYAHALKHADRIGLSEAERILTHTSIKSKAVHVVFGMLVALLALTLPENWNLLAGGFFTFIGIPLYIIGNSGAKKAELIMLEYSETQNNTVQAEQSSRVS